MFDVNRLTVRKFTVILWNKVCINALLYRNEQRVRYRLLYIDSRYTELHTVPSEFLVNVQKRKYVFLPNFTDEATVLNQARNDRARTVNVYGALVTKRQLEVRQNQSKAQRIRRQSTKMTRINYQAIRLSGPQSMSNILRLQAVEPNFDFHTFGSPAEKD
ncbi:hypothetical protein CLF_109494 [Clonorchis sinensis]|uniref:Uncharacterized protein n=1 Tax=Clonorchis sinensis TaxID=79923 RepID=G7YJF2_CLOSI|nr:hypothetical protein CLF_109494 [Clonorchis sinensis]